MKRFLLKRATLSQALIYALTLLIPMAWAMDDPGSMENNVIHHFRKGQQWMAVDQPYAAIREYQFAIRLKPATPLSATLYNNMGLAYLQITDLPRAIVSFQQAIALNPQFSLFYENLAKAYSKAGILPTATQELEETLATNPDDVPARYLLGLLYKASGNPQAFEAAMHQVIKDAPKSDLKMAALRQLGH